jgi:hypothetical protein
MHNVAMTYIVKYIKIEEMQQNKNSCTFCKHLRQRTIRFHVKKVMAMN